ncbi:MAG: anti-sigma F factor [Ruminococcaceae bacterium]|nr:anti-sigma F factor [Oscillospiraceae bacterium]
MEIINEFNLNIESRSVNESFCRVVISAFIAPLDPTIEELSDLKTALSEAVTNSIVHGYKNTKGKIYINAKIKRDNTVVIKIRDKGRGIEDIKKAMTPLYSTGDSDRAGLGFTVMESFCDKVKVFSKPDKGTTVVLTKKITGHSAW